MPGKKPLTEIKETKAQNPEERLNAIHSSDPVKARQIKARRIVIFLLAEDYAGLHELIKSDAETRMLFWDDLLISDGLIYNKFLWYLKNNDPDLFERTGIYVLDIIATEKSLKISIKDEMKHIVLPMVFIECFPKYIELIYKYYFSKKPTEVYDKFEDGIINTYRFIDPKVMEFIFLSIIRSKVISLEARTHFSEIVRKHFGRTISPAP